MRLLTIAFPLLLPLCAAAQTQPNMAAFAAELGITEDQVQACLPAGHTPGQRVPRDQREAVFNCFKAANPDLTQGDLRKAAQAMQN